MKGHIVLRIVSSFLLPFIILFGLYIQFHGEYSPGGGFQAGVIVGTAFIVYGLIFGTDELQKIISYSFTRKISTVGVLLYAFVGIITMLKGSNFLAYNALSENPVTGQQIGIFTIELGVGITVFSVVMLIYYTFATRIALHKSNLNQDN